MEAPSPSSCIPLAHHDHQHEIHDHYISVPRNPKPGIPVCSQKAEIGHPSIAQGKQFAADSPWRFYNKHNCWWQEDSKDLDDVYISRRGAHWANSWLSPPFLEAKPATQINSQGHVNHESRTEHIRDAGDNPGSPSSRCQRRYCDEGQFSEALQAVGITDKNRISISSDIISRYCDEGLLDEALQSMDIMDHQGLLISTDVFSQLLERCIKERDLRAGREVSYFIVRSGLESDSYLGSFLIRLFTLFDSVLEAKQVFNKLSNPTVFSWTAIISAHTQLGLNEDAILLFQEMDNLAVTPDGHVFVEVLKACSSIGALEQGNWIHTRILENGFELDQFVGTMLVDMYCKHGSIENAEMVFDRLPEKDVVTWSALIAGYVQHGYGHEALHLFQQMQEEGVKPDKVVFVSVLQACLNVGNLEHGKEIHSRIIDVGLESDQYIGSTLIDMYAKSGNLEESHHVFDKILCRDLVAWSALMSGYAQQGHGHKALQHGQEALRLFKQMQKEGMKPDNVTYVCALQACSSATFLQQGQQIHVHTIESGIELDLFVGNTLIDMYGKCCCIDIAEAVFQRMPQQDLVTWSALIAGYALQGHGQKALQLFNQMQERGMKPNQVTFVCILQACSCVAALEKGRQIHGHIIESGLESDLLVANTLIDTYIKCGSLENACTLFDRLPTRDAVTWSALLSGHALLGDYISASQCFMNMQQTGLKPTGVTYLNLLSACSHVGLVDEGCLYFKLMRTRHEIIPTLEHYTVMVDLLGRAGCLNEAEDLLETLPCCPNIVTWTSLLGSCRRHVNVEIGRRSFDRIVTMEGRSAASYVLMSNIYVDAGMREESKKVEELRMCGNVWKKPAKAFIEIGDQVHDFIVGDDTHPRSADIYAKLNVLSMSMKEEGYVSQPGSVLDPILKEKEDALCGHSEKLAIAFGLICAPHGTSIRVAKNLRVCVDCHNFARIISKMEMREIIINDAYCIHHFKEGACSCKEY